MNRNELKQVAHGLKEARPSSNDNPARYAQWRATVTSVANALELKDKPRSNFLAAAGAREEVTPS